MRIWTLHPKYLDGKGLVALWRETLLAQKVLLGETKGYRNHPQLERFRTAGNPVGAVASYLREVVAEAQRRGYNFDASKIVNRRYRGRITVTTGQVAYERAHLRCKLVQRAPQWLPLLQDEWELELHPVFKLVDGLVEPWEVV
ncbi:MAG: pyrimidine dimer DNA glycosylase/endonuclease V [Chromatiales bacterium]|nr:pyrimidine dimer DNA glycosylase/endonuclease V [Chromatiales bacterium]